MSDDKSKISCFGKPFLSSHLPALNGLRGLAVVMVFLFHAGVPGFSGGFIGVDIFFILSGFLITLLLLQEYQTKGSIKIKQFYIRRILRLFPALLFLLLVFVLFCFWYFTDPTVQLRQFQDAMIALFYAANWTRAFDLHRPDILGHCWSLSVEEQFYFVWPFILMMLLRLSSFWRSCAIALLFFLSWGWRVYLFNGGVSWDRLYNDFGCRADMLLAGCLLASLWNAGYLNRRKNFWILSMVSLCMAGLYLGFMFHFANWQGENLYLWQYSLVALAGVVGVLELINAPHGRIASIFSLKPLVWLGNISYGFYLWHYPVLFFLGDAGVESFFVVWAAFITLVFTCFSWYCIELPFQGLKKHFR